MIVEIIRMEESKYGTLGAVKINKQLFCCSLEPPDNLNKNGISSIPIQQYMCQKYSSPKYPDTFQIMDVPDRTKVLFHAGNTKEDTKGCILLGRNWGYLAAKRRAVLNSGNTFKRFIDHMRAESVDEFHLTIYTHY